HSPQLGCGFGETGGGRTIVELGAFLVESLFCGLLRFFCSCLVDVTSTDSRIGEHLDHARLNLEEATRDVEHLFGLVLLDHPNRTRLEVGQQRCVTRQYADVSHVAVCHDHLDQTGKQLFFRAYDIAVHCHSHLRCLGSAPAGAGAAHYILLAFSTASSMVPTM